MHESLAGAREPRASNTPTSACNANQWRTDVARRDDSHEHNCSNSHLNKILCVEPQWRRRRRRSMELMQFKP